MISAQTAAQRKGFTIVELLIVIVVIAVLATITIVAYTGIQQRARDSQRASDISTVAKALELYYADKGQFPSSYNGGTAIAPYWTTTADASWANLMTVLQPYAQAAGLKDPVSTPGVDNRTGNGYNYSYYANTSTYCGAASGQMYIIVYRMDTSQKNTLLGDCSTNVLLYGGGVVSNYRVSK